MSKSLTSRLAEKICSARPIDDEAALRMAKHGVIDYLASCFAGIHDDGVKKLLTVINQEGGAFSTPLIGQNQKASMSQAALFNGFLGHVLDFDDVHSDVRGHPSTVILPTLFSLAANESISGDKFLAAYCVGVEVMARLGEAIGKNHYVQGWHNTSTLGGIAAASAGSFLKGFTPEQTAKAIGFAATQASGMRNQFGTEMKPLHAGIAAKAAVFAIQLTEAGFNGTTYSFDGELSFFNLYGDKKRNVEEILLDNWGDSWRIHTPGLWFKLYPFCSAAYHGGEAAIAVAKNIENPAVIESVRIIFPPGGDAALIHRKPVTGEEGRFSIEYIVALALSGYSFTTDRFTKDPIQPNIRHFMEKIERIHDASIQPAKNAIPKGRFTIVEVKMDNGDVFQARVDVPKGSPIRPLEEAELVQKLFQASNDESLAKKLIEVINKIEILSVDKLLALL